MPLGKGQKTQVNVEAVINVTGQENIRKTSQQLGQLTKQFAESKLKINWNKTGFNNVVNDVKDLTKWVNTLNLSLSRVNDIITISGKDTKGTFFSSSYKLDPSKFEKGAWANRSKTSAFTEISNSAYIKQADAISNLRTAYSQLNQQISKMKSVKRELGEDSKAYQEAKDSVEEYKTAVKDAREFIANNFTGERLDSKTGLLTGDSEAARTDRKLNHELQYIETLNEEQAKHQENTQKVREYVSALKEQWEQENKLATLKKSKAPQDQINQQQKVVKMATDHTNALKNQVVGTKEYAEVEKQLEYAQEKQNQKQLELNQTTKKSTSLFGNFKNTLKQVISAGLSWKIFSAAMNSLKDVQNTVIDLDKSLVDLQIVMGSTREEAREMLSTYFQMAQELGSTTKEVATAAVEWQRQGYTIAETNTLIKNSMILSKVGMIESAEAQQYLTSAMKGYNVSVNQSLSIVDQLTAIDMEAVI